MDPVTKRVLSVVLALITLSALLCTTAGAINTYRHFDDETFILGDADGNRSVDAMDLYLMRCHIVGINVENQTTDIQALDFDADTVLSAVDVYHMRCLLVGRESAADFENGHQLYKLTIAGNDINDYEIVVSGGTEKENVYTAATILSQYIYEACGVRLGIVFDTSDAKHVIHFNRYDPLSDEALALGLGNENYIIDVKNGDVNIYGSLRGTMYAAYEICEKYLGVRFYDNEYVFLYKTRTSDIPEGTHIKKEVQLTFRYSGGVVFDKPAQWGAYYGNRLNGSQIYVGGNPQDGYLVGPHFINAHSFSYYYSMGTGTLPDESYGTLSQRYTAKFYNGIQTDPLKWQPCATDETTYDILFTGLRDTITMLKLWGSHYFVPQYGDDSMSFSINDNSKYCSCRLCGRMANGVIRKDRDTGEVTVIKAPEGNGGLYMQLANKAVKDIQEYMSGLKLFMILYDHTVPATIRPDEKLILMYCGHGCNNHIFGSGECGDGVNNLGYNNNADEVSLKEWVKIAHDNGAQLWFWSYGVNFHYFLGGGCPNIPDFYENFQYIVNVCGADGIYFEGAGNANNFEKLKSYIAARLMWEPDMSHERFVEYIKEYLYMYYGDGYEILWNYILMQTAAGDLKGCTVNNYDRPWDQMDKGYLAEHYEEMHAMLAEARDLAKTELQKKHIDDLSLSCEFMGLSSVYKSWYTNGTEESRALYEERYTSFFNAVTATGMEIFDDPGVFKIPKKIDFTVCPMTQFYNYGSWADRSE